MSAHIHVPDDFLRQNSPLRSSSFVYGTATAAFQIEGASTADGRLPSIWDTFCATPGKVMNGDTGEIACDHFNRWKGDVELISSLGCDAYRLSLAWPRLLDRDGRANEKGFDYYKRLLDLLGEKGIRRFVTLYHWDLPQWIEDEGGWVDRDTAYRFAEYADLATRKLAGRAETWSTLNEPFCSAWLGYGTGEHAPGFKDPTLAFNAGHHLLLGHGLAVTAIRANDPGVPVGIALNLAAVTPASDSAADRRAADYAYARSNHWFVTPLLAGKYHPDLIELHGGRQSVVVDGDMEIIRQPVDFFGINYYTRGVVEADPTSFYRDVVIEDVPRTIQGWEIYPQGLTDLLKWLKSDYPNVPPIYITENGMAAPDRMADGVVNDADRIEFLRMHLRALDEAVSAGVDVRGYLVWSFMDNFEWAFGYDKRFGLVHVDFETQARTPKRSALWFRDFIKSRSDQAAGVAQTMLEAT